MHDVYGIPVANCKFLPLSNAPVRICFHRSMYERSRTNRRTRSGEHSFVPFPMQEMHIRNTD